MFRLQRTLATSIVLFGLLVGNVSSLVVSSLSGPDVDPMAACALGLLRSQLSDSGHIVISGHAPWVKDFLKTAKVPVTVLQRGQEWLPVHNLQRDVFFFVTNGVGDHPFVERALTQLRIQKVYYARVIFWWRTGNAQEAVEAARLKETVRIAVVSGSSKDQQVLGYREDCINGTALPRAILIGNCSPISLTNANIFLDLKRWNFRGCPLSLLVRELSPHSVLTPNPKGGYTHTGPDSVLGSAFAKYVNAVIVATPPIPQQKSVDACSAMYFASFYNEQNSDISPLYYVLHLDFIVPSSTAKDANLVHRVFPPEVWILVGTAYVTLFVILAMSWWGVTSFPVLDAACFALCALLGIRCVVPLRSIWTTLCIVAWIMLCLFLGLAHQAMFSSLQTIPQKEQIIHSLSQLAASGKFIQGNPSFIELIQRTTENLNDPTLHALTGRLWSIDDWKEAVRRVAFKRDVAMLTTWEGIADIMWDMEKKSGRKLIHKIKGNQYEFTFVHFLTVRRGSRLSPALNVAMTRALDTGLYEYVRKHRVDRPYDWASTQHSWRPLDMASLKVAFQLLAIGLATSVLVAAYEYEVDV